MPQQVGWAQIVLAVLSSLLPVILNAILLHAWPSPPPIADSRPQSASVVVVVVIEQSPLPEQHKHSKAAPRPNSKRR